MVGVYFNVLEWNMLFEEDQEDTLDEGAELDCLVIWNPDGVEYIPSPSRA
jgi:hypothetical protein